MSWFTKTRVFVIAGVAAIATFLVNIGNIIDFAKRLWEPDDISVEIAGVVNHNTINWSSGGRPTGEMTYAADLFIKKTGAGRVSNCTIMINMNSDLISYSDNSNRSIGRGSMQFNWHYEYKIKKTDFVPDVTLQVECGALNSNAVQIRYAPPK